MTPNSPTSRTLSESSCPVAGGRGRVTGTPRPLR
jgi:hypothetical protein